MNLLFAALSMALLDPNYRQFPVKRCFTPWQKGCRTRPRSHVHVHILSRIDLRYLREGRWNIPGGRRGLAAVIRGTAVGNIALKSTVTFSKNEISTVINIKIATK